MIDYTKAAIEKTIGDLKKFAYFFNIAVQLFSVAYLVYAIVLRVGYVYANIALCAVTVSYTVFYIIAFRTDKRREENAEIKTAFKWIKLGIKAFSLVVAVYGVYIAAEHTTLVSIVMASINVISWLLQLILTITVGFVESRANLIADAIKADIDNAKRPLDAVGNIIKRVRGEEVEPKEPPTKNRIYLDGIVQKYREKKEAKRAEERARRIEKRMAAKKSDEEERETVTK